MTAQHERFVTERYEVTLTRVFDADSYEDALFQMVNHVTHHASESLYHITNLSSGANHTISLSATQVVAPRTPTPRKTKKS
jgi:hypothetical protein